MLVLPIEDTFLYVEPIYIQAAEARMPQLRKVVLAMGNTLIYRDTYEEALAELAGITPASLRPSAVAQAAAPLRARRLLRLPPPTMRLETIRKHLNRYRELAGQGRWAEAGKELEALESEVQRK
jgi:uncharacterized membrane protein (UPF0182 family)